MKYNKVFALPYRRKRDGKTDYKKRLVMLKSKQPRLVVRKSNKNIQVQLIEYAPDGDKVLLTVRSGELKNFGWNSNTSNIPSAYLVGLLAGVKSKDKEAILDIGLQASIKGSRIFAVLKGASDGGLKINFSEEVVPSADRIEGKHISGYAKEAKKNMDLYNKRFSGYLKNKLDAEKFKEYFEKTKEKILSQK